MPNKVILLLALIIALTFSFATAKDATDELKAQYETALKDLNDQITPEAKAKIGGELKFWLGNTRTFTLTEQNIIPANPLDMSKQMKDQMDRLGIKVKRASPEVVNKIANMINQQQRQQAVAVHKKPAYLWYQNNKLYFSGLLIL